MAYILAVDGGGTTTKFEAFDKTSGNTLFAFELGSGNLTTSLEQALETLKVGYKKAKAHSERCTEVVLGMAGWVSCDQQYVTAALNEIFDVPFKIYSDIEIAHAAAFKGESGILALSGTGSVFFGKNNTKQLLIGGWGFLLGDEGSGYWFAKEAVRLVLQHIDEDTPDAQFDEAILMATNSEDARTLITYMYTNTTAHIAQLAKVVMMLATEGNETALALIKTGAEKIAYQIEILKSRLDFNDVRVAFAGSTLTKNDVFKEAVKLHLQTSMKWVDSTERAIKGCYYLAL